MAPQHSTPWGFTTTQDSKGKNMHIYEGEPILFEEPGQEYKGKIPTYVLSTYKEGLSVAFSANVTPPFISKDDAGLKLVKPSMEMIKLALRKLTWFGAPMWPGVLAVWAVWVEKKNAEAQAEEKKAEDKKKRNDDWLKGTWTQQTWKKPRWSASEWQAWNAKATAEPWNAPPAAAVVDKAPQPPAQTQEAAALTVKTQTLKDVKEKFVASLSDPVVAKAAAAEIFTKLSDSKGQPKKALSLLIAKLSSEQPPPAEEELQSQLALRSALLRDMYVKHCFV